MDGENSGKPYQNEWRYIWVFPKIGGKPPKMDGLYGKPYVLMDDLGVPLFLETSSWGWLQLVVTRDEICPEFWILEEADMKPIWNSIKYPPEV